MTDGSWDDYVDLSGIDTTDPSTAVPAVSEAISDFADTTDLGGGVSDLDQVSLDTASYQSGLAADQQSWADWNSATGDQAVADATSWTDYGNQQLAAGNTDIAESAFASADSSADYAADNYDAAASNEGAASDYLDSASSSMDSVDYSTLDTAVDTSTSDYSSDYSSDY